LKPRCSSTKTRATRTIILLDASSLKNMHFGCTPYRSLPVTKILNASRTRHRLSYAVLKVVEVRSGKCCHGLTAVPF
jgi:hypothetical protein